jgi:hypothetical protein
VWHIVNGLEAAYAAAGIPMDGTSCCTLRLRRLTTCPRLGNDSWDGRTAKTAFLALQKAYNAAKDDPNCEKIVVLSDLSAGGGAISLVGTGAVNTNVITIEGSYGTEKVSISGNGTLITVGSGVKIAFQRIVLVGKDGNSDSLVKVNSGGTLFLENGAVIKGNKITTYDINGGGGVRGRRRVHDERR